MSDADKNAVEALLKELQEYPEGSYLRCGFCGTKHKNDHSEKCIANRLAAALEAHLSHARRTQHCQNGTADVCLASKADGVICPAESCDIDDGVRKAPRSSIAAPLAGEDEDDFILRVARECGFGHDLMKAMSFTRWKDGIDIDVVMHSMKEFVRRLRAAPSAIAASDTKRLEWLFSVLNDVEVRRKVNKVSDEHAGGAMKGIQMGDWRASIDAAMAAPDGAEIYCHACSVAGGATMSVEHTPPACAAPRSSCDPSAIRTAPDGWRECKACGASADADTILMCRRTGKLPG